MTNQNQSRIFVPASSTVFLSLILLLVASLLFTLLESARIDGLKSNVRMDSELVTESLLAEYCKPLMERYHLFLLDAGYGSGTLNLPVLQERAETLLGDNLSEDDMLGVTSYDLYHIQTSSCTIKNYRIVTDENGEAFYQLVTDYMKNNLSFEAAELLYQKIKESEDTGKAAGNLDEKRENALDSIEKAKEESEAESTNQKGVATSGIAKDMSTKAIAGTMDIERKMDIGQKLAIEQKIDIGQKLAIEQKADIEQEIPAIEEADKQEVENPIDYIADWKNTGILTLIGADESKMSNLAIDRSKSLENREKISGTAGTISSDSGWYERILFQEYLMKYLGCYTSVKEGTALGYELEYLIAGKSTDKENLSSVATRLLAIREAANFVFIQADKGKCAEALTLATLIIGYTGNAVLVKIVQEGILAAWAFAESVSDVKSLLNGEKIPIVKTPSEWSTNVKNLSKNQKFEKSKDCKIGLDYQDYLRILLYLANRDTQCLRAMDLIEQNLNLVSAYENLRMDAMIDELTVSYTYTANPLFLSFVSVGTTRQDTYQWSLEVQDSYLQQK